MDINDGDGSTRCSCVSDVCCDIRREDESLDS